MSVYGKFEFAQKSYVRGNDVGDGEIGVRNLNPGLFLETQLIRGHTHSGVDSLQLDANATPYMIKGYQPRQREEHGVGAWSGGASATGSLAVTFGTPFTTTSNLVILVTQAGGNDDIIVGIGSVTITGFTIYWRNETGTTHTSLNLHWIAFGR